jgi:hypothetical protein
MKGRSENDIKNRFNVSLKNYQTVDEYLKFVYNKIAVYKNKICEGNEIFGIVDTRTRLRDEKLLGKEA